VAFGFLDGWLYGAEEEWARDADVGKGLAYDAWLKGREVGGDVG